MTDVPDADREVSELADWFERHVLEAFDWTGTGTSVDGAEDRAEAWEKWRRFRSALRERGWQRVPEGWRLVPEKVTPEWASAMASVVQGQRDPPRCEAPSPYAIERCRVDIECALSASPSPPGDEK